MDKRISREELYKLIWNKPITKIAKDYKVSDSAIIKICKKMEIPRPGLGYWTRVQCGKKVIVTPLPKLSKRGIEHHHFWQRGYMDGQTNEQGQIDPLISREAADESRIIVSEKLDEPHPLTTINWKCFNNSKADERGILKPQTPQHFSLTVTKGSLDRALRIMDALMRAFEVRGWDFEVRTDPQKAMFVMVLGEEIRFSIEESVHAMEHVLTDKETRARARGNWTWPPRYDYVPTGKLKLSMDTFFYYSARSSWSDGKIQRVENCLNKFCASLVQYAQALKQKRIKDEKARIKRELEATAYERYKYRVEQELKMRQDLGEELKSWRFAEEIRAYVAASVKCLAFDESMRESHDNWSYWALAYADSIDPLAGGTPIVKRKVENRYRASYHY